MNIITEVSFIPGFLQHWTKQHECVAARSVVLPVVPSATRWPDNTPARKAMQSAQLALRGRSRTLSVQFTGETLCRSRHVGSAMSAASV